MSDEFITGPNCERNSNYGAEITGLRPDIFLDVNASCQDGGARDVADECRGKISAREREKKRDASSDNLQPRRRRFRGRRRVGRWGTRG